MGTDIFTFKGSPFWQEIRTGLFVIQDYDWKRTLLILPNLIDTNNIIGKLQTHEQILSTGFRGISVVKGKLVNSVPRAAVLEKGLPPEEHYNIEALTLQWLYHFYIVEGVCNNYWGKPIADWPVPMYHLIEQSLEFLTYVAAVMCLMEEGQIKEAPTKSTFAALRPQVEARISKITETLLSKTADYGESYRRHGLQGSIPRLWDKIARFAQLSALGRAANYEPKADALKDLLGYSVIAWSLVIEVEIDNILAQPEAKEEIAITVNGQKIGLFQTQISYEQLSQIVYGTGSKRQPTVVYTKKSGSGTIHRDQSVSIEPDMRFEVVMTNCA